MKAKIVRAHSIFKMDVQHETNCEGPWQWQWITRTRVSLFCDRLALELSLDELDELRRIATAAIEAQK